MEGDMKTEYGTDMLGREIVVETPSDWTIAELETLQRLGWARYMPSHNGGGRWLVNARQDFAVALRNVVENESEHRDMYISDVYGVRTSISAAAMDQAQRLVNNWAQVMGAAGCWRVCLTMRAGTTTWADFQLDVSTDETR